MQPSDIYGGTFCTSYAAFAAGTGTSFTSTGATLYCIKGKAFTTSAASNSANPTTDGNTGVAFNYVTANHGCVFVYAYDGSSTTAATAVKVYQGPIVDLDAAGNFIIGPEFPAIPDTVAPFAYLIIQAGSTTVAPGWLLGTSNSASVTGITYTRVNLMTLPSRPQVS